jgi:hypothetical protein
MRVMGEEVVELRGRWGLGNRGGRGDIYCTVREGTRSCMHYTAFGLARGIRTIGWCLERSLSENSSWTWHCLYRKNLTRCLHFIFR